MIRIGSRKSELALKQTELVCQALRAADASAETQICTLDTLGDKNREVAIASFGGKGAFTKEIEEAMIRGELDLAVHSAKDLPMEMTDGLGIGAVLARGDERDVIVSLQPVDPESMGFGSVIGTGSRRRALQMLELNPGIVIKDIRGNVPTRLKHLAEDGYDAILLAAAGLKRLGYLGVDAADQGSFEAEGRTFYYLIMHQHVFLPAAGQGIIAVQAKCGSNEAILAAINDRETQIRLACERSFLMAIGGGCNEAAAVSTEILWDHLILRAKYARDTDEMKMAIVRKALPEDLAGSLLIAEEIGQIAARRLFRYFEGR